MLVIVLRPEQGEQRVATVETPVGQQEIKEEGYAFGLAHHGIECGPIGTENFDLAQHP